MPLPLATAQNTPKKKKKSYKKASGKSSKR